MSEKLQRNMVQRLDGRMVNAGRKRGMLTVCATGCCCGHTDRGFAPIWEDLYHNEWERRKLRNRVHLNMGGCLGPCPLANVSMLLFDGRSFWFHSLNEQSLIIALYDFIEAMVNADSVLPVPDVLTPHVFNGFAWDGNAGQMPVATPQEPATIELGDGIVLLTQADTDLLTLEQVRPRLPDEFPALHAANIGHLRDDEVVERLLNDLLPHAAVVVVRLLSGARSFEHGLAQLDAWANQTGGFVLCLPSAEALDPELMARSNVGVPLAHTISAYFQSGGAENITNGLCCLSDHLLVTGWGYDPPRELPRHGVYEPATQVRSAVDQAVPTVGILFYRAHLLSGNTAFVDAIIEELASQGLQARAIFTQSLKDGDDGELPTALQLMKDDRPVDAIISTLSFAIGNLDNQQPQVQLPALDVPIFQAIASSSQRVQWQRSGRGLGPLDTAMNVAIPEFDGRIITVPISFKEASDESAGSRYMPDLERIERLVGLVRRTVALRHKPNAEKRIAFVLTNSSAKAARVGNAVGLDAPASLLRLLHTMREQGYTISTLPATSDQLLLDLIDRCSYDQTWLTETQLSQAFQVPVAQYETWFADLPESRQRDVVRQWEAPPGKAYVHDDAFALAGLSFNNIFVALQPPRGYHMDPNAIYHQPDLPPPHNYHVLYRWLRDTWQADAIVHVGKHGTLEWLPGKGVGLGSDCFPDLFLDDLPLIYPFIINDPGEGNQAKRRTHAVIVDHMTPPMTSAGSYGDLAELAQLVDEYYQVEKLDPSKLPLLQRQIWDAVQKSKLDDDLSYILKADHGDHTHDWDGSFLEDGTPTAFAELEGNEVAHLLEDIEGYLCELTGAQIRDGLHILGTMPEDDQLVELIFHLLKLPNLHVPSLAHAVAQAHGEDWQALQEQPGRRREAVGVSQPASDRLLHTNADMIAFIEAECKHLLGLLNTQDWDAEQIDGIIDIRLPHQSLARQSIAAALHFACEQIVPKLHEGAHDEIVHLLHALNGGHVPAGPSGAPTRGMAHVLPTGRNFYAVDPRALPSVAAWQVGQGLADTLLRRYQVEEGRYPESVGISIWGTSAMRTSGDDIAQVLALLGVRPTWQHENRRVVGVEVIPLAELGRPRVDVVCRISGFFRDAFPHLITLLDQATQAVIALDEPLDQNFPRKRAVEAEEQLLREGLVQELAAQQSRYRIFGCKPGSYGAGILPLIDAQNWLDETDFARAYITWGGYAYTADEQGTPAHEAFGQALSGVQVATKNQDNREHDIFDSDDYLQFHGGMIATIRALSGQNPRRYFGDSSNPQRPHTRDLREEARRVFRSRVVNPKWIESMRRHGYKGALEVAATVDYLFGYDATAQVLDDWMYHTIADEYLRNEEMQQFFADSNPWAWQSVAERLLEAVDRGLWQDPDPLDLQLLKAAESLGLSELRRRQEY
ncbi:MAG: cobalt chelatase [Chloroflexi bacterium AL-W]|nr:cobalt chelatase [Chloroflexi bacterium AL-N1]NOK71523.1 cobalt chelatase [Chloroflexi bacterium AL-N10]NOK78869.1 cobalt chelatase [Chloroflexi bacterium AL-N5]NOK86345.1 cobalt chelatase [Chloroflexi bacterium AL-W]NOK93314.1 cobalt chelatase [Chloroflexi bacterium AL-N15]